MLSLTVQEGEYLLIGDDIKVTFQGTKGKNAFSIGVDAPRAMRVVRSTLYESMVESRAAEGDAAAMKAWEALAADRAVRERDIQRKAEVTERIRARKAREKAQA